MLMAWQMIAFFRCLWWAVWLLGDAAARDSELNEGWAMPIR